MTTLIIYHAGCIDGFTAAWCAWQHFRDDAEYAPGVYGNPPPDVTGRDVLIVDFSYPRDVLLDMTSKAKSIRVFDHHKSAQEALAGLGFCVFDMERSGAGITWDELFEGNRPPLVDYVEDRDLWRFRLPHSKEINAYIGSIDHTFANWNDLSCDLRDGDGRAILAGKALLRAVDRYVGAMVEHAREVTIADHRVLCVNAPYINTSELVGHLAERNAGPFAVGWFQRADGLYQYSLRSRGDFDVSEIAKRFGGGGHKNAAGFAVKERVDS